MGRHIRKHDLLIKRLGKISLFIFILFIVDLSLSYFLKTGLEEYYGINKPSEILMVGHSHTMLGLNKDRFEARLNCSVAKYAIEGANVQDRLIMIKHFLNQNGSSVKILTYDVDAFFLTSEGLSKNSYKLFYPFIEDKYISEYLKTETRNNFDFKLKKIIKTSRFSDLSLIGALRGYLGLYSNLKIGKIDTLNYQNRIKNGEFVKIAFDKGLKANFEETLEYVQNKDIILILILIPTIDILNKTEPEKYQKAVNLLEEYSIKYKNVFFFNYNSEYADQHDLFYDQVHLNPSGNKIITERLIKDIEEIVLKK